MAASVPGCGATACARGARQWPPVSTLLRRYLWVRPFMRQVLTNVVLLLAQTAESAQRFQRLGAPIPRVRVVGNTNIDRALLVAEHAPQTPPLVALVQGKSLLVGGSTHEGEETMLLSVYRRLRQRYPNVLLVLAPRHLERVPVVMQHVQGHSCKALRRHSATGCHPRGSLMRWWSFWIRSENWQRSIVSVPSPLLVVAWCQSGDNILEPAVYAKPVILAYMQHFPELAALLCAAGGAMQVQSEAELYERLADILAHPEAGYAIGQRALQTLAANRGALERTLQAVTALLTQPSTLLDRGESRWSGDADGNAMDGPFLLGTEAICLYARLCSTFHMAGARVAAAMGRGTRFSGCRGNTVYSV